MINCIIVEDEKPAADLLEQYILKLPHLNLIQKCKNALEAQVVLNEHQVDLMFLDIQMPDLTGLEFLKSLTHQPYVVMTTAYSEYALEGFELNVTDYLLKPISFDRFLKAVNKVIALSTSVKEEQPVDDKYFFVKADYKQVKINFDEVDYVEGLREYVSIYVNGERIITLDSMKNMEKQLPSDRFMRIHKSYIVALNSIRALNGNMVEISKEKSLPVGKSYKEELIKLIDKHSYRK